ncbi:hypothetical protein ACFVX6_15100 [Streptomyces sp. NPDC058289]|uniref:hypothetical protein n=1 Tax=Streptomyces sp. NPDC058289 TaxID=3346425 RepID=UPI0036E0C46A
MNTFLDYLVVLTVAAVLLGPSLYWAARERRLDRQIRAAEQRAQVPRERRHPQRRSAPALRLGGPSRSPHGRGRRHHVTEA